MTESKPEWITLDAALRELGDRQVLVPQENEFPFLKRLEPVSAKRLVPFLDGRSLRRKCRITAEGIELPSGQLLYRFADQEPRGEAR